MTLPRESARISGNHLQSFSEGIWIVDGPVVRDMGARFPTRMTIVKLSDESLWVSSPVPRSRDVMNEIESLGNIRYLIAGTPRHLWRLASWHNLYPDAQQWAPPQAEGNHKRFTVVGDSDLEFSGILSDNAPNDWKNDLDQVVFRGSRLIEELVFYHKKSHTLIMDDLIQNYPRERGRPIHNALIRLLGVSYPNGGMPFDIKMSFIHRDLARQSVEKILSWDFDKLVLAHGVCVERDAKSFFKRAFKWLNE